MAQPPFTVEVVGQTTTGLAGKDIVFPDGPLEVETHLVEVAPKQAIGRHRHPGPCWMYVLDGEITAESDDGTLRTFRAGEVFVEDAGTWVDNRNAGTVPARFLALAVGHAAEPKIAFED